MGKPRTHVVGTARGIVSGPTLSAHGYVSTPLTPELTLEQKIEAVQENALRALRDASQAMAAVTTEQRKREQEVREMANRLEGAETTLVSRTKRLVVDGIPAAVAGLVLATVGLTLQALASLATFSN